MKNRGKETSARTVLRILAGLAAVFLHYGCSRGGSDSPILITKTMDPAYSESVLKTLNSELEDPALRPIFKRELLNRRVREAPWLGRIKFENISYQAVFGADGSRFGWTVRSPREASLHFSIFSSAKAGLLFRVSFRRGGRTEILFQKRLEGEQLEDVSLPLERFQGKKASIVFETLGRGVGAWLNPTISSTIAKPRLVIVLMIDALRADHLPLYGYGRPTAPALDELAREADVYKNAYSTTSWTLPAHVSLFSGRDISDHGVYQSDQVIPPAIPLISEVFQANGYVTAAITGGGFIDDTYGFHRGFQLYWNDPGAAYLTESAEKVFRRFEVFHKKFERQNCFLFLHTLQTHAPYKAPGPFRQKFNPGSSANLGQVENWLRLPLELFKSLPARDRQELVNLYDASIAYTDQALVKALVDYLKAKNLYENALLAVCSDHGEEFFDHGSWQHGNTLYAEVIHIPLIIKRPGPPSPRRIEVPVSIADLPRKVLAALDLKYDEFPGTSSPLLQSLPFSPYFSQLPTRFSVIDGSLQFIRNFSGGKNLAAFNPSPNIPTTEAFRIGADGSTTPIVLPPAEVNRYLRLIQDHIMKLGRAFSQKKELSQELRQTLRSLGYIK